MSAPTCSVVVVNWNGRHHLEACLGALQRQSFTDFEVLLVDNGSSDGSLELVRERYPWVGLLPLPDNRGFAGGNNEGIRRARGRYVALLNNDTEAEPDWLAELVGALERHPEFDLCASRVLFFDQRDVLDSAGDYFGTNGVAGKRGHLEPAERYSEAEEVFGACAAAALYRRSLLDAIGLLDEDFFLIFEDADLSFRARNAGHRCLYVPSARVYHKTNASIGTYSDTYVYYGQRNVEYVYLQNMPLPLLLKYLPAHCFYGLLALAFFASRGRLWSFLRAKAAVVARLPAIARKRRRVQSARALGSRELEALFTGGWLAQRWAEKGRSGSRRR